MEEDNQMSNCSGNEEKLYNTNNGRTTFIMQTFNQKIVLHNDSICMHELLSPIQPELTSAGSYKMQVCVKS
ncbi:hypothetical protein HanIR_Chr15g0731911 [Helianthus annuus]|nr:hypothetical protein HanIR_Chr15g0731911 [Helianthus annuus]